MIYLTFHDIKIEKEYYFFSLGVGKEQQDGTDETGDLKACVSQVQSRSRDKEWDDWQDRGTSGRQRLE